MSQPLSVVIDTTRKLQVHRRATLWEIERVDGVILRFTDHDEPIESDGETFDPAGGFDASARETVAGTERAPNLEVRGIVSSSRITESDLLAGKYREANVSEWLVDWRHPWYGRFDKRSYTITETESFETGWRASMEGKTRRLRQVVGNIAQRRCKYDLGEPIRDDGPGATGGCGVDLASFTESNQTVTSVESSRRQFSASVLSSSSDNRYKYGVVKWLTGNNVGLSFECQAYLDSTRKLTLFLATPYDIEVGDTFDVIAGCDGERSTCRDVFDNVINHGGYPWVPGTDKALSTPLVPEE